MAEPLLVTERLTKSYGGLVAMAEVDLAIAAGELRAVIGPNGAGKTTLVAHLAGELRPDAGRILFAGQDITALPAHQRAARGLARSFQITSIFAELSVLDNVALAVQAQSGHSFRLWTPARRLAHLRDPAWQILRDIGFEGQAERRAGSLAHGDKRVLEMAMVLAMRPRLLLLDEPMAGMGREESARLVQLLAGLKGRYTILLVEHDMDAVFALADAITVLVYGRIIATGTVDEVRRNDAVRRAYLGTEEMA